MKLTAQQVKKVAKLANLPLTEEEEVKFSEQLSVILEYIQELQQVNTDGVEPTYNVSGNTNITREDKAGNSLTQEDSTRNAKNKRDGFFITKGVFEQD